MPARPNGRAIDRIAAWRRIIAADGDHVTTAQLPISENLTQADQVRRLTLVNRTRRPLV
jgi:hypothetical protein